MALARFALVVAMLLIPSLGRADSVWSFTGELTDPGTWHSGFDYFNTHCNCALDGTILFGDNFNVLAYSWTDGTHTLNQNDSIMVFENNPTSDPRTNPAPFSTWLVSITGPDTYFHTNYDGPNQGATSVNISVVDGQLIGWGQPNNGPDGTWTELVSTPEASSLICLLAGIAFVTMIAVLRRKRLAEPSLRTA